jgi:hypothetical protein
VTKRSERAHVTDVATGELLVGGNLRATLRAMVEAGLERMRGPQPVIRMLFHDADRFPNLRDRFRDEEVQSTFAAFAAWIRGEQARDGVRSDIDAQSAAAVLVGAVVADLADPVRLARGHRVVLRRAQVLCGSARSVTVRSGRRPSMNSWATSSPRDPEPDFSKIAFR